MDWICFLLFDVCRKSEFCNECDHQYLSKHLFYLTCWYLIVGLGRGEKGDPCTAIEDFQRHKQSTQCVSHSCCTIGMKWRNIAVPVIRWVKAFRILFTQMPPITNCTLSRSNYNVPGWLVSSIWIKMYIISRLATMASAIIRRSPMRKRAKTILTSLIWKTLEKRMSRRKCSSKSCKNLCTQCYHCHHHHRHCYQYSYLLSNFYDDDDEDNVAAKACCCAC